MGRRANRLKIEKLGLVGESDALAHAVDEILLARPHGGNVVILGPLGTGRRQLANALHSESDPGRVFHLECWKYRDEGSSKKLGLDLFGCLPGLLEDAPDGQVGLLSKMECGGLFVWENIHLLSHDSQVLVLEYLDTQRFCVWGDSILRQTHMRLAFTALPDLRDRVKQGQFDDRLYYRMLGHLVEIPSFQDRPEDVSPILDFFSKEVAADNDRLVQFSKDAKALLAKCEWRSNALSILVFVCKVFRDFPHLACFRARDLLENFSQFEMELRLPETLKLRELDRRVGTLCH